MWRMYNPNPTGKRMGDCTVRAVAAATRQDWRHAYLAICLEGLEMCDMPSSNAVWGGYLRACGFIRRGLPDACPECETVRDFAGEHPRGVYVLALDGHVVTLIDGDWYDTWDSGDERVLYVYTREE